MAQVARRLKTIPVPKTSGAGRLPTLCVKSILIDAVGTEKARVDGCVEVLFALHALYPFLRCRLLDSWALGTAPRTVRED